MGAIDPSASTIIQVEQALREKEIVQFAKFLDMDQPALIAVAGEDGMGKSTLLRVFQSLASRRGWRVAPNEIWGVLRVEPNTTEENFCNQTREMLNISQNEPVEGTRLPLGTYKIETRQGLQISIERLQQELRNIASEDPFQEYSTPSSVPKTETRQQLQTHIKHVQYQKFSKTKDDATEESGLTPCETRSEARERIQAQIEELRQQLLKTPLDDLSVEDKSSRSRSRARSRRPLHLFVEQLRQHAPVLLLIDGYHPGDEFAKWFVDSFIADVKRSRSPIVIVVADVPGNAERLSTLADVRIPLSPPDKSSISQALERIAQHISPRVEAVEIDVYLKEVEAQPAILRNLMRVLLLAQTAAAGDLKTP
ncbi:MAG: ATP-binding protein [Acidobacteria bacterium]|nr:ATP-binding protein [Acidobacteriota bacterium]